MRFDRRDEQIRHQGQFEIDEFFQNYVGFARLVKKPGYLYVRLVHLHLYNSERSLHGSSHSREDGNDLTTIRRRTNVCKELDQAFLQNRL